MMSSMELPAETRLEKPDTVHFDPRVRELAVPSRLAGFIRNVRHYPAAPLPPYRRIPDGELELIVRFGAGAASATLIGTRTRALEKPSTDPDASSLLFRFRRGGAHPFFGCPLARLTDEVVALSELWPRAHWLPLEAAGDTTTVLAATCAGLGAMLEEHRARDSRSARALLPALQRIAAAPQLPQVSEIAADLGMSERQLRREFDHLVGLSPKRYLRVVRFRRALHAARHAKRRNWAEIAEQMGYFDQAHLIADFRALTGLTPTALVNPARPA